MDGSGSDAYELWSRFTDEEWSDTLLKLRLHAEFIVRKKQWTTPAGMLPKGFSAAELAQEAISRFLTGRRQWDPQKEPDFLKVLKGAVRSIASELVNSLDHTRVSRFGQAGDDEAVAVLPNPSHNPHEELEEAEAEERLQEWIWSQLKDDEELEVFLCMVEGCEKVSHIAGELEKPAGRISQVLRNMRRRLERARRESDQKD